MECLTWNLVGYSFIIKGKVERGGRTSFPSFLSRCQESAPPLHWVVEFSRPHIVKLRLLTVIAQWK